MSKILQLVDFALNDTTKTHNEINFGTIPNFQAQSIASTTGVTVKSATKILTAAGIRHAFAGHGNQVLENKRGQIGITRTDFDLIPIILTNFDFVIKGNEGRKGQQSVVFVKQIDLSEYHVVMGISKISNGLELVFNTMFIKNKKPMFPSAKSF